MRAGASPEGTLKYEKLYFIWYFDDNEGYGIEVMGQLAEEELRTNPNQSRFASVVNWSFGQGTEARDLRRAWGEYVADRAERNQGLIPPDFMNLSLRFNPECGVCQGQLSDMKRILHATFPENRRSG